MAIIKTPDQRVRVFISSTINELAEERKAAREAIANLRLIPVFFEAGARPHPPRDLYAAYLEQSHIFVGIYWNSYGWVAPGATISGLEDEYRLCGNRKPKLIYVKQSDAREEKLNHLLKDIQDSETACYQKFSNAAELLTLLENDLSVLMSEIFENALFDNQEQTHQNIVEQIISAPVNKIELPLIRSELIGREQDLQSLEALIFKPTVNLINILGAGGTGKTSISIHLAHRIKDKFRNGVFFIPLAPVTDSNLVAATIASALDVQDSGKQPVEQTVVDYLSDKQILLILDNFEQIVEASHVVSEMINNCPGLKLVVTSRATLHIRGENIYHLLPLETPGEQKGLSADQYYHYPAIELFITRAREVNSQFQLNDENQTAVATICNKLDGLPLAIELAASRTKLFQPTALLKRMDNLLDLASKGQRDLPERQQTLRNTIEWSYNLLDDECKKVFCILGVFKRSWTLEAADAIINSATNKSTDIEDITEKLLDVSLIKPVLVSHADEPRFNMLQTVHEFANEMLNSSEVLKMVQLVYSDYFLDFFSPTEDNLFGMNAEPWLDKIEFEYQNIRAAYYYLLLHQQHEKAWKLFYLMVPYWTIRGGFTEAIGWIRDGGIDDIANQDILGTISNKQIAQAQTWAGFVKLMMLQIEPGYALLYAAEENARKAGDNVSLSFALAMDGCYGAFIGLPDAGEKIEKSKELSISTGHSMAQCFYYSWSYEYYRQQGRMDIANNNIVAARNIAMQNDFKYVLGSLYIINYSLQLMDGNVNFENIYQQSLELYQLLPDKGYKGLKAAAMGGMAYSLMKLNRFDEVEPIMMKTLEYARESGEKESEFYTTMSASQFFKNRGDEEKACKLFGAVNAFIESTSYPLIGPSQIQYDEAKAEVMYDEENLKLKQWYEEGKKMRIEEAVVYAMKRNTFKTKE